MKADLEIIETVLKKHDIEDSVLAQIRAELVQEIENNKTPREKATKKDFVLLVSDPNGVIPDDAELTGWAIQIDPKKGIKEIPDILKKIGTAFNDTPKGQKLPAESVGDLFETAPGKTFSENGIFRKHKDPVFVMVTNNKVADEEEKF